jgi:hypothetical protein
MPAIAVITSHVLSPTITSHVILSTIISHVRGFHHLMSEFPSLYHITSDSGNPIVDWSNVHSVIEGYTKSRETQRPIDVQIGKKH